MAVVVVKMIEAKLRWFGHVKRRCANAPVRCGRMDVGLMWRGRSRPKKYREEAIRHEVMQLLIKMDMTLDRKEWRSRIRVKG